MQRSPTVFIGSSSESLPVAEAFQQALQGAADVEVWTQGVFGLSQGFLESLLARLDVSDFAVLVLTADDTVDSRGVVSLTPRDNVLFELGLFMGRLGKERCFFAYEQGRPPKLPSDLLGISAAAYRLHASGNLEASIGPAATAIKCRIQKLGARPRLLRILPSETQPSSGVPDISGEWTGYSPEAPNPNKPNAVMQIEQHGSFISATIDREVREGTRKFEHEGRLTSGQLVLFFEEVRGRGFIVGTVVLYLSGDLQTLTGKNTYYHHTKKQVVSTELVFRRVR
jgi:hypothetical protein